MQGSVPAGQQMTRDQSAGVSNGRLRRETSQQLRRQHSELPFHSSGRGNNNNMSTERPRPDSRPRQALDSADPRGASGHVSGAKPLDRQHSSALNMARHGSSGDARLEQRSSSRQHSRQKARPPPSKP